MKYEKNDEITAKYVGYVEDILQEMKITEIKWISKVDAKQTLVYDKLSPNLEPNVNDAQFI